MNHVIAAATLGACLISTQALSADSYPIAGTAPYERPAGAPRIEAVKKDQAWYANALHGVSKPYPKSLYFLDNQGNWYTPFNRPGMLPPYDLRGWHRQ